MANANPSSEEKAPTGSEGQQTSTVNPPVELSEEAVKNHPAFKKLEKDYSAAEREKNRYKGRLDKVQKGISDEEEPEKEPEQSPYVTKDELWEFKNANDVEIYGDEQFKKDVASGIPRDYALNTAKLRFQSNPDKARLERQQVMASGTAVSTRNLSSDEFSETELKGIADGLYTKETVLKHRELKKSRGQ